MFSRFGNRVARFVNGQDGATAAEMGILISLIAVVVIGALLFLGSTCNDLFNEVAGFFSTVLLP